jgi:cellulose biosynthesis protein BcsQ
MENTESIAALAGACGGAGTTRLTLEAAATLARAGRTVAVVDVAVATQGLAGYVPGRIDPDLTRVLVDDRPLADALVRLDLDLAGTVAVAPACAPFERLARAQTAGVARTLSERLAATAQEFDHVLVDVGPVASNLAVAAVTAADRVTVVAPPGDRGADAVQRTRGRLADVGAPAPAVVVDEGVDGDDASPLEPATTVPESDVRAPTAVPAVVDPDPAFAPAVAAATEVVAGVTLDLSFPTAGLLGGVR